MEVNSAAMELQTGNFGDCPTQREVYAGAPELYAMKEELERHLCRRTDSLFNLTNRIMLFRFDKLLLRRQQTSVCQSQVRMFERKAFGL